MYYLRFKLINIFWTFIFLVINIFLCSKVQFLIREGRKWIWCNLNCDNWSIQQISSAGITPMGMRDRSRAIFYTNVYKWSRVEPFFINLMHNCPKWRHSTNQVHISKLEILYQCNRLTADRMLGAKQVNQMNIFQHLSLNALN